MCGSVWQSRHDALTSISHIPKAAAINSGRRNPFAKQVKTWLIYIHIHIASHVWLISIPRHDSLTFIYHIPRLLKWTLGDAIPLPNKPPFRLFRGMYWAFCTSKLLSCGGSCAVIYRALLRNVLGSLDISSLLRVAAAFGVCGCSNLFAKRNWISRARMRDGLIHI